jgi:Tol biopolymer transport system component
LIKGYSWSPDGGKLVLSAGKDIFTLEINKKRWENITNSLEIDEYYPQWSSTGENIYYLSCSHDRGYGSCGLVRYTLAGKDLLALLNSIDKSIVSFAVSPNDQNIVFSVSDGFDQLYQSDLDGSNVHRVTVTDLEETSPSFSHDGQSVAYVRTNRPLMVAGSKLQSDIIVQNSNWVEEKNLTEEFENVAGAPAFSLDGKWIAFDAYDENLNYNIYVVSVGQTALIQITQGSGDKVYPSWRSFYEQ